MGYYIRFLRDRGADIDQEDNYGETLLMKSAVDVGKFKMALSFGANPNKQISVRTDRVTNVVEPGYTIVHYLVVEMDRFKHALDLLKVLPSNVNLDIQDETGQTALMLAAGHPADDEVVMPILDWLLSQGVDVNLRNNAGLSALDLAQREFGEGERYNMLLRYIN